LFAHKIYDIGSHFLLFVIIHLLFSILCSKSLRDGKVLAYSKRVSSAVVCHLILASLILGAQNIFPAFNKSRRFNIVPCFCQLVNDVLDVYFFKALNNTFAIFKICKQMF
jgi:hypothetical protein